MDYSLAFTALAILYLVTGFGTLIFEMLQISRMGADGH